MFFYATWRDGCIDSEISSSSLAKCRRYSGSLLALAIDLATFLALLPREIFGGVTLPVVSSIAFCICFCSFFLAWVPLVDDRVRYYPTCGLAVLVVESILTYKNSLITTEPTSRSYFDKLLQQEQTDVAIARKIIAEYDGDRTLAANKIDAIVSQSDRATLSNNPAQIAQYKQSIMQQAKILKQNPFQSQEREQ